MVRLPPLAPLLLGVLLMEWAALRGVLPMICGAPILMALVALSLCSSRPVQAGALSLAMGAALALSRPVSHSSAPTGLVRLDVSYLAQTRPGTFRAVCRDQRGRRVLLHSKDSLAVGTCVLSWISRYPVYSPAHPWAFDEAAFWAGRGVRLHALEEVRFLEHRTWKARWSEVLSALRSRIRCRLRSGGGTGDGAALMLGMATGDRTGLSAQAKAAFSGLGLAHITAVSGMHVGMLALLVTSVFRWLPEPWRATISVAATWGYVLLSGAPSSSVRAAWMATLAGGALVMGRKGEGLPILSAVGVLMWAAAPHLVRDVGTQLSFLATAGILIWHAGRTTYDHAARGQRYWLMMTIPWVATCSTAGVAWTTFGKFPPGFLPANVMASVLAPAFMGCAVMLQVVPLSWSKWLAEWSNMVADCVVNGAIHWASAMPAISLPRSTTALQWAGGLLCASTWAALACRRLWWLAACGTLLCVAALRWQAGVERDPEVFIPARTGDHVVLAQGRVSVLPEQPERNPTVLKWNTRSLLERVSSKPHMPWKHVGGVLVWTPNALVLRTETDTVLWVSSSGSPFR